MKSKRNRTISVAVDDQHMASADLDSHVIDRCLQRRQSVAARPRHSRNDKTLHFPAALLPSVEQELLQQGYRFAVADARRQHVWVDNNVAHKNQNFLHESSEINQHENQ